jgi:myosin heavy subunit
LFESGKPILAKYSLLNTFIRMAGLHPSLQTRKKQAGVPDFVLLNSTSKDGNSVTEDAFLENLKTRFQDDTIYTYIGSVVVSVNPFKPMAGLYGPEAVKMYRGQYYYEVPPHIFALTDDAYR